jgi:preprotein translocase subunit SecA
MRIFASERVSGLMKKLGMKENEVIAHPLVNRAVENAQRKVEGHNFDIRKQLLKYDDVANDQRKVVYSQRDARMAAEDIGITIQEMREEVIQELVDRYVPPESFEEQWDIPGLEKCLESDFNLTLPIQQWLDETPQIEGLAARVLEAVNNAYREKEATFGPGIMRQLEKSIMLESLDNHWKEHIAAMDHLRQGIHLRGYAQKDPAQEFKRESFNMFTLMLDTVKYDVVSKLSTVQIQITSEDGEADAYQRAMPDAAALQYSHSDISPIAALPGIGGPSGAGLPPGGGEFVGGPGGGPGGPPAMEHPYTRATPKVGRNEPCPCGSGRKFKQCHGSAE